MRRRFLTSSAAASRDVDSRRWRISSPASFISGARAGRWATEFSSARSSLSKRSASFCEKDADFELVFVMILAPWVLTTLQFQVFDRYLMGPVKRDGGLVDDISEIPLLTAFPTRVAKRPADVLTF